MISIINKDDYHRDLMLILLLIRIHEIQSYLEN